MRLTCQVLVLPWSKVSRHLYTNHVHVIFLQTNPLPLIQVAASLEFCVGLKSESCRSRYQINARINSQEKTL